MMDHINIRSWWKGAWLIVMAAFAFGQTFEVNPQQSESSRKKPAASSGSQGLGWGSSLEVARQARAAQDALQRGDYSAAANYAEHAANSAPQNTELWFLLGYAARLAERYQMSIDAYKRGLQNQPNSVKGLAGLAQTYVKMGHDEEAKPLLMKVVAANPRDATSLQLAGELLLSTDPNQGVELLRRADELQASARTEVLIARGYQQLQQPEQSKQYLARAKSRAPRDPDVLRAVAGEYRDAGEYDLAIATLKSIPRKTADVQAELAYTYQLAGNKEQAAEIYSRLARAAKGNVALSLSAAQALVDLGQPEAARAFLENVREKNPTHYRLHAVLAQIAQANSELPSAIREYQTAISNLPSDVPEGPLYPIQLRLNLYELYVQTGSQDDAKQQLNTAAAAIGQIRAPKSQPEYLRLRASIEAASGNFEAADKDLTQAMALAPNNVNAILNYGTLLWKMDRKDAAQEMFEKALRLDGKNRMALTSLGYLARDRGDAKAAAGYFSRAVRLNPKDFGPYLALGDLYASTRDFRQAEVNYEAAYKRMATNPMIVAGGTNAALESHDLDLAKAWLDRAHEKMSENPQIMRERQRYLTWKGDYQEAARLGYKVLEQLPRDRQAPVYLAYDLYYLGRYDEALDFAVRYESILPNNKDLALIAGYVHVRSGKFTEALADFTRAVERDPTMSTGYANRGFVLNDLRQPSNSVKDFRKALELRPDYGEAHLGLAFSYLQLHRPKPALEELDKAGKLLGENRVWHLGKAEGFRQEQKFREAEKEYRAALAEQPNDLNTQLALADTLFRLRRYKDSVDAYQAALKLSPNDPVIYAQIALAYAKLGQRDEAMRNLKASEQYGKGQASVLMATGNALLVMGETEAAMQRFASALDASGGDRASVRLAIAEMFRREGRWDDARRQIALGFAEARVDNSNPVTSDDFVQAANIFLAMHDFDLARIYFEKARLAGANPRVIAIGLANTYTAEGNIRQAELELASLGDSDEYQYDYDYQMTRGNLYRQRQDTVRALSAFARASTLSGSNGDNDAAETAQNELAGEEGRQITQKVSVFPVATFTPVLEDVNIYTLDARFLNLNNLALLPPPRHNYQSIGEAHYRVHLRGWPMFDGFVGERMTSGTLSFPSTDLVQDRHTYDTILNGGISPVLHLGTVALTFNGGLQFTLRRDTISPRDMNQDLFRQYLYLSTSSLFNWVSIQAGASRETGPFTERDLHSRDLTGNIEFTVGRPWGRTSLLAGYSARDLLFRPLIREYYTTSSYVGLQRKFGNRFTVAGLAAYMRSWRVQDGRFAIAQAMVPGGRFEFRATPRWTVQGSFTLSRGEGFHAYDNAQSQFLISYMWPVRRNVDNGGDRIALSYPLQFSIGLQQQTFYNFPGQSKTTALLPVVQFRLF